MASTHDPDLPPSFPLANSAQRQSAGGSNSAALSAAPNATAFTVSGPTTTLPSKSKSQVLRSVLSDDSNEDVHNINKASTSTPRSSATLMPPPSTSRLTAPPGVGGASGATLQLPARQPSTLTPGNPSSSLSASSRSLGASTEGSDSSTKKRNKVVLTPGHSPLDWARLKSSLRPPCPFGPIPMSEVKKHKTRESAWTIFHGKVYDIGPYLDFHPGGVDELMRVAGRDGTRLFMLTHSWVNIDSMIDACCIGFLVKDE